MSATQASNNTTGASAEIPSQARSDTSCRGQRGRGQGNNNDRRSSRKQPFLPQRTRFAGETEELKGSIYDVGTGSQADMFITTTKAIASYAGCTCTDPQDIRVAIQKLEDTVIAVPQKEEDIADDVATIILSK